VVRLGLAVKIRYWASYNIFYFNFLVTVQYSISAGVFYSDIDFFIFQFSHSDFFNTETLCYRGLSVTETFCYGDILYGDVLYLYAPLYPFSAEPEPYSTKDKDLEYG
jgi:hypothetical protein